jgi:hypothetical protein
MEGIFMTTNLGFVLLLFTYGFTLAYHLMGATKHCALREFDWYQLFLGVIREFGFIVFWLLVSIMPNFVDLQTLGIDVDFGMIVSVVLVAPLMESIKKAYEKSQELRNIIIDDENDQTIIMYPEE